MRIPGAVISVCFLFAPLAAEPVVPNLPLMPWPAHIVRGTGQLDIDAAFTAAVMGSADPRVRDGAARLLYRLFREPGIPASQRLSSGRAATLLLVTERPKPGLQKYRDDESYRLTITSHNAKLIATEPLGVLRGIETFLQLVHAGPAGFAVPSVDIADRP